MEICYATAYFTVLKEILLSSMTSVHFSCAVKEVRKRLSINALHRYENPGPDVQGIEKCNIPKKRVEC